MDRGKKHWIVYNSDLVICLPFNIKWGTLNCSKKIEGNAYSLCKIIKINYSYNCSRVALVECYYIISHDVFGHLDARTCMLHVCMNPFYLFEKYKLSFIYILVPFLCILVPYYLTNCFDGCIVFMSYVRIHLCCIDTNTLTCGCVVTWRSDV